MSHPEPVLSELEALYGDAFVGGPVLPALVPDCCIDMSLLARFHARMKAVGEPAQPQRMRYDRRYAFERIAVAHSSADELLRALALQLFAAYQGEPGQ
jgi:hypothetical protein